MSSSSTDAELMEGLQAREAEALDILVRRYEDLAFRLAVRMLHQREEARDLVQDVFLDLWTNPQRWKPQAEFSTWLYRVVTNRALNRIRFQRIRRTLSFASQEVNEEELPPSPENVEDIVVKREQSEIFQRQFANLPPRQKAALHLRYEQDLPVGEVAKALGVSFKAAESLIFRGKQTLKKAVKK
ncbi:MAG: sigma-70 family RNA polymerase sigma factor [Calditrichota bacterium]